MSKLDGEILPFWGDFTPDSAEINTAKNKQ